MQISIFDLFKIGIGPSSSHTMGPMVAAKRILEDFQKNNDIKKIDNIEIYLYGSLALTGLGHSTDKAIILGLMGESPKLTNTNLTEKYINEVKENKKLNLLKKHIIEFNYKDDLILEPKALKEHPNALKIVAKNKENNIILDEVYFSIGGGFIANKHDLKNKEKNNIIVKNSFKTADELLKISKEKNKTIAELMIENELCFHSQEHIDSNLQEIWKVMQQCVKNGYKNEGILPGGLNVVRRAPRTYKKLTSQIEGKNSNFDWVSLYALAVNEENAAGGRVVTAPTNGAAGIIPSILHFFEKYHAILDIEKLRVFFMTSGAIGLLYKENASISGAEMGCQGEVGVACSMAAGGLCALMGGSSSQIESAAEIGMEHNLGLTCDPIKGLVQVPCIERNTMGAIKAINAARLAMQNEGTHIVSLDKVIKTMKEIGDNMKSKYKETSKGGLAINVVEC